jgi:hypothetical protein
MPLLLFHTEFPLPQGVISGGAVFVAKFSFCTARWKRATAVPTFRSGRSSDTEPLDEGLLIMKGEHHSPWETVDQNINNL